MTNDEILKENNHLITLIITKYRKSIPNHLKDDFNQELVITLMDVYPKFDGTLASSRDAFLVNHLKWRLFNLIAERRRDLKRNNSIEDEEIIPDREDNEEYISNFNLSKCKCILDTLSEEERLLLILKYSVGITEVELGLRFGVSQQAINQRLTLIKDKIKWAEKSTQRKKREL